MLGREWRRAESFKELIDDLESLFVEDANLAEIPFCQRLKITVDYRSAYEDKQRTDVAYDIETIQSNINSLSLPYHITNTEEGIYKIALRKSRMMGEYSVSVSNLLYYLDHTHSSYNDEIKIVCGAVSRLYNHAYGLFYPLDEPLEYVYSVDDINQMLYHRRIPYRFRCYKDDKNNRDVCRVSMIKL